MPSRSRACILLVATCGSLLAQSPPAPATPSPDDRKIQWQRSLADAEALAKATGRPLLLVLNMDGESASDRMPFENYRDPRFVTLTRRVVCVGASVFRHNATDHDAQGRRLECPRFCGLTCGEHMALEPELFAKYFRDGERVAPRHALVRTDGSVAFDLSLCFDLQDVDRALVQATEGMAPWSVPAGDTWSALAARRDAAGRARFEAALAQCDDAQSLREAAQAVGECGDAGSLAALEVLVTKLPALSAENLVATAARLGLRAQLAQLARARGQRLGALPGDLRLPPELPALLYCVGHPEADLRTRTWLCGLAATTVATSELGRATTATWGRDRVWDAKIFADDPLPSSYGPLPALRPPWYPPVSIAELLQWGDQATLGQTQMPAPGVQKRELASADELHRQLGDLDMRLAQRRDDADLLAAMGIASLDLARVQLETGGTNTQLLLEDAANYLARACERKDDRYDWWLERARAAYHLRRFDQEAAFGERALSLCGHTWPPARERYSELLRDAHAVEAVKWIGDAAAQQFAGDDLADPLATIGRLRAALLGLGLVAMSPFGTANDQLSFASFAAALGLSREELAILRAAQRRLPAAGEIRQAVYAALWSAGRPEWAPALADEVRGGTTDLDAAWWAGHARVLLAEDLRRRQQARAAAATYEGAGALFAEVSAASGDAPTYRQSADTYHVLARLGQALALAQGERDDRELAMLACVPFLLRADVDVTAMRDGLGCDALDLIDRLVEWRADGPSPVAPDAVLSQLPPSAPHFVFWATAISDSALREALRADGRNPQRREGDTVDAAGKPIRALLGLPTELGDRYLAAAIAAGARAAAAPVATDLARRAHAQALVIFGERELVRERTAGVAAALTQAASALGLDVVFPTDADIDTLRRIAASLRERLGPARPRQRDGR